VVLTHINFGLRLLKSFQIFLQGLRGMCNLFSELSRFLWKPKQCEVYMQGVAFLYETHCFYHKGAVGNLTCLLLPGWIDAAIAKGGNGFYE